MNTTSTAWLSTFVPQQRWAPDSWRNSEQAQRRLDRPVEAARLAVAILQHLADNDDAVAAALAQPPTNPLHPSDAELQVSTLVSDL